MKQLFSLELFTQRSFNHLNKKPFKTHYAQHDLKHEPDEVQLFIVFIFVVVVIFVMCALQQTYRAKFHLQTNFWFPFARRKKEEKHLSNKI